jgi:hypothetical protein
MQVMVGQRLTAHGLWVLPVKIGKMRLGGKAANLSRLYL